MLTIVLLVLSVVRAFFSPVDLFARANSFLIGNSQFLLAAIVFYGFSSVVLRAFPLPTGRSVLYTCTSGLLFLWAFHPVVSNSGMMRRIAGTMDEYLARQTLAQHMHLGAMVVFVAIQFAYLWFVARRLRELPR